VFFDASHATLATSDVWSSQRQKCRVKEVSGLKPKCRNQTLKKGQGLVEYALILVLVAIVVIAVLMILGPIVGNVFSTLNSSLLAA
jgi:pilus assembly protein Flp/PilA